MVYRVDRNTTLDVFLALIAYFTAFPQTVSQPASRLIGKERVTSCQDTLADLQPVPTVRLQQNQPVDVRLGWILHELFAQSIKMLKPQTACENPKNVKKQYPDMSI